MPEWNAPGASQDRDDAPGSGRRLSLRTLTAWGYVLAFGAPWGLATFGYTSETPEGPDTGRLWLWAGMLLVGLLLLVAKNRRIAAPGLRARLAAGDALVLCAALVLIVLLPATIGILKGLILLVLFAAYLVWSLRMLDAAGAWE